MPQNPAVYRHLSDHYLSLPHCRAIDLQAVCTEHDQPVLSVANRADLAGRSQEGTIHGGVITALVDVASASAVAAHLPDYEILATLDMRIDYMHPALTDRAVQAKSTCYRLAGQVAFVRTLCYQEGQSDPVALGTATFMRTPLESAEKQQLAAFLAQQQSQPAPFPPPSATGAHFHADAELIAKSATLMPYAAFIGLQTGTDAESRLYALPYRPDLIGNIFLPALHGGLIGGFMESCAALYLYEQAQLSELPKMIDFSLDYLRSAKAETAYARCILTRQGSRITNIAVEAWQADESKPFAVARCHFQMP